MRRNFIDSDLMLKTISSPTQDVIELLVILGASVVLQAVAGWIALTQTGNVAGRYRAAWVCVGIALTLMVERRLAPMWRLINAGELCSFTDAVFGMAISILMAAGIYGIREVFSDLESKANTDALTGLASRSSVMQHAQHEIDRAVRSKHPMAVLMFDIDQFKIVNDRYGHPAGDLVLCAVADIARGTFRHIDYLGRIGGEEFLAVLPDIDLENATAAAERFRKAIAAKVFTFGDQQAGITMSIGIAIPDLMASSIALKDVMKAADAALYAAKNLGRNRVVVDEPIKHLVAASARSETP